MRKNIFIIIAAVFFISCSPAKWLSRTAQKNVLQDTSLRTAHVGISIYDPATSQYLYNYQGDKYFVPASNTKIPTCYAAMKYLGDSIVGLKVKESSNYIFLHATGDPTFLHEDYKNHPVYNYLKSLSSSPKAIWFGSNFSNETALGSGWTWNDYDADYMAERSAFPIYGNVVTFSGRSDSLFISPGYFRKNLINQLSTPVGYVSNSKRQQFRNQFTITTSGRTNRKIQTPFITSDSFNFQLLGDTLSIAKKFAPPNSAPPVIINTEVFREFAIHSQPTDSLLKPLMHRSDNFFAEQSLLMVSNKRLGVFDDAKGIDTLLKTVFADLPHKPRWVDGSGLSRYNLFTPQDFVVILNKMKNEFGMERIKNILPTGNEGTLTNYYKDETNLIFAKTGTLSGVVALSGFLYTKQNKLLIFSVLVNNHQSSAPAIRRAIEKFIKEVRGKF